MTAAAPALLEALTEMLAEADRTNAAQKEADKLGDSPGMTLARAALALAEGGGA